MTLVSTLDKNFDISIQGVDIVPENFRNLETIGALLRKSGAKL
jgi:acyl carrier protein